MQMNSEFVMLVNRLGLNETEEGLARIVWTKCEKTLLGKGQEAVLLGGKPDVVVRADNADALTPEETNFLIWLNRNTLNNINEIKLFVNSTINKEWNLCNPDDELTQGNFEMMNQYKSIKRKLKRQANMLSSIQRKLKKHRGI